MWDPWSTSEGSVGGPVYERPWTRTGRRSSDTPYRSREDPVPLARRKPRSKLPVHPMWYVLQVLCEALASDSGYDLVEVSALRDAYRAKVGVSIPPWCISWCLAKLMKEGYVKSQMYTLVLSGTKVRVKRVSVSAFEQPREVLSQRYQGNRPWNRYGEDTTTEYSVLGGDTSNEPPSSSPCLCYFVTTSGRTRNAEPSPPPIEKSST